MMIKAKISVRKVSRNMLAQLRRSFFSAALVVCAASAVYAQTGMLQGHVIGPDGQPLKGAVIDLTRQDIKGHYSVKTDKKGRWLYNGLPVPSTFTVECIVDGKVMDKVNSVKVDLGDLPPVNFDLQKVAAQQQQMQSAMQKAAQTGQVNQDVERGMSKEQKEQFEAAAKKNSEAIKKNKALNDAYTAGVDGIKKAQADTDKTQKVTDYQAALASLASAQQMDPNQQAIYEQIGLGYYGLAGAQTGDEKTASLNKAAEAYNKVIEMQPDSGPAYNQLGNIYAAEGKMPEAEDALTKAAQLDPQTAPKAYFNMGANLVNHGKLDEAIPFFKKATDADPNYAEAWFQLGTLLMNKGAVDPKTGQQTYPPDTAPAFQKYLQLQPNGPHVQEAQAMLQAMGQSVQTKTNVPTSKRK